MNHLFKTKFSLIIKVCILSILLSGCSDQITPIQADPNWTQGTLENGLKYHIYHKQDEPVEIRLIVHSGAYDETLQQYGYAHFLEHMAFNGSKHFTANESVEWFEQIGVQFGPDLNAYTSYSETVYQLSLPDTESIEKGLLWFRDIADGLLLTPEEINKEKGVVLDEIREASSGTDHTSYQIYKILSTGSALDGYDVLGTADSIRLLNREQLIRYYRSWYVANNSELIIVGDITASQAEEKIRDYFADWKSGSLSDKKQLTLTHSEDLSPQLLIPPQGDLASVDLIHPRGLTAQHSVEEQIAFLSELLAYSAIHERLKSRAFEKAVPVTEYYAGHMEVENVQYGYITLYFAEQDREAAQAFLAHELSNLRGWGVSQTELESALAYFRNYLENYDANLRQLTSGEVIDHKVKSALLQEQSQSDAQSKQVLQEFISTTSLKQLNDLIAEILLPEKQKVIFTTTVPAESTEFDNFPLHQYEAEIKQIMAQKGQPLAVNRAIPLLPVPEHEGRISEFSEQTPSLYRWKLENGVEVWLKQMPEAEKHTYIQYAGKGGWLAMDNQYNPALEVSLDAINRSNFAGLDAVELERYLTAEQIYMTPELGLSHHGLYLEAVNHNLPAAFSLLRQAATGVRVTQSQLPAVKRNQINELKEYLNSDDGKFTAKIRTARYGRETSQSIPDPEALAKVTGEQIDHVYQTLFRQNRNFKLILVSAKPPAYFEPYLKKYIANIQYDVKSATGQKLTLLPGNKLVTQKSENDSEGEYYLVYHSLREIADTKTLFVRALLQNAIERQLFNHIREAKGFDYGPSSSISTFDNQELASIWFSVTSDKKNLPAIKEEVYKVISKAREGISAEELDISKRQLLNRHRKMADDPVENVYALRRYLTFGYDIGAFYHPEIYLDSITTNDIDKELASLTKDAMMLEGYLN